MNDKNNEVLKQHFKTTSKEVKRACIMAKSKREEKLANEKNWKGLFQYVKKCRGSRDSVGPLKEKVCGSSCSSSKECTDECKSEVTVSDPKGLVEIFGKYFGSIYSVSKIDIPEIQPLVEGNGIEMIELS